MPGHPLASPLPGTETPGEEGGKEARAPRAPQFYGPLCTELLVSVSPPPTADPPRQPLTQPGSVPLLACCRSILEGGWASAGMSTTLRSLLFSPFSPFPVLLGALGLSLLPFLLAPCCCSLPLPSTALKFLLFPQTASKGQGWDGHSEAEPLLRDLGRGLVPKLGCATGGWAGGKDSASSSPTYTVKFGVRSLGPAAFGLGGEQPPNAGDSPKRGAGVRVPPPLCQCQACWSSTGGGDPKSLKG